MAKKSTLLDVFEKNQYDLKTAVKKSRAWFEQQVLIMTRQQLTPQRVLNGNPEQLVTRIMPGHLYHYLPYPLRINLLDNLLTYASNQRFDETTRLKYSWALIDGMSKYAAAKPCVKQYLVGHVRTQFRQVESSNWATAMLLPVERFVGASKQEIWADSRKIIRKN